MKNRYGVHQSSFLGSPSGRAIIASLKGVPGIDRVLVGKRFNGRGQTGLEVSRIGPHSVTCKARVEVGTYFLHLVSQKPAEVARRLTEGAEG